MFVRWSSAHPALELVEEPVRVPAFVIRGFQAVRVAGGAQSGVRA